MQMDDESGLDGPRGELLRLLESLRDTMALTDAVIRALVEESEFTYPSGRLPLLTSSQCTPQVRFVVQGVAKIVCDVPRFERVTVDLVGKGEFLCLPPAKAPSAWHRIEVVVHEGPIVLALMPRDLVASAIGHLPPSNAARLVSCSWRAALRLAYAKTALLLLPTRERLIRELARLARRFGRPQDDHWTLIQVRLFQEDLASLIVRSRSNVSRAFTKLRKAGVVDRVGHRILIATSVLDQGPPMVVSGRAASRPTTDGTSSPLQ